MEDERRDEAMGKMPMRVGLREDAWLRLLAPADADVVFAVVHRNRQHLRRWLPWVDGTIAPADTRAFIEETIATEGREYAYGIWTGEGLAGCIGLHTDPERRSAMVGYWIDENHEGRGLVTDASRALTEIAFRDLAIHRVWLSADPRNTRSCAVAERLGFSREGVHREDTIVDGRFRDTAIYAILEHEWPPSGRC
ncbi:MAG: GNAT family N-acetyltransferase [Actinomycetota bacterium]